MYNANVYCRQIQAVYDNGQTGTVVRDGTPRQTVFSTQTAGHQDRLTDGLTDRLPVVTSLFSISLGFQMVKRVQMGGRITTFGRSELLVRYV